MTSIGVQQARGSLLRGCERSGDTLIIPHILIPERHACLAPHSGQNLAPFVSAPQDGHFATAGVRSRRFAQAVGVITDARYRRRGYGAGCMSALCQRCFAEGKEAGVLFREENNLAAQALYAKLGFTVVGDFLLAEYPS